MLEIDNMSPSTGRLLKEDGTYANEAETIDSVKKAVRMINVDSGSYDVTHDATKTSKVWNNYKDIPLLDELSVASETDATWDVEDDDIAGARDIVLYYNGSQPTSASIKLCPNTPADWWYSTMEGYSGRSIGGHALPFKIGGSTIKVVIYNEGADAADITHVVIRLLF